MCDCRCCSTGTWARTKDCQLCGRAGWTFATAATTLNIILCFVHLIRLTGRTSSRPSPMAPLHAVDLARLGTISTLDWKVPLLGTFSTTLNNDGKSKLRGDLKLRFCPSKSLALLSRGSQPGTIRRLGTCRCFAPLMQELLLGFQSLLNRLQFRV